MKSASNGGVLNGSLQVLHVHVFLAAPLGARHMAKPCADQHQSRVTVRETTHHTGAAADLPVPPLNDIVGTEFLHHSLSLLPGSFLALLGVDGALSILATSFTLERGVTENTLR